MKLLLSFLLLISTICNAQLIGDSATDNTFIIQSTIDAMAAKGGGMFFLPTGNYMTDGIVLRARVRLVGESKGTRLILKRGATGDLITCVNAEGASIENLTLDANMLGGRNLRSAIVIRQDNEGASSSGLLIANNLIINAGVDGIQALYPAWMFRVQNNDIINCERYGIYNTSTDNEFFSNNINHGNRGGFYCSGSSTRIIGGKIIGCSMYDSASAGMMFVNCFRGQALGVEAQDNYYHGFLATNCTNLMLDHVNADGNGVANYRDSRKLKGYGFYIANDANSQIQGQATNYNPRRLSQYASVYMLKSSGTKLTITESGQVVARSISGNKNIKLR